MQIIKMGERVDLGANLAVWNGVPPEFGWDGYYWFARDGLYGSSVNAPKFITKSLVVGMNDCTPQITSGQHLEERGRVEYIDGCSSSLLIYPPKLGQPCVNYMHVPKETEQTFHTHPSHRIGLVLSGGAIVDLEGDTLPINEGYAWIINPDELHRFRTLDVELEVLVFHPDSDWGPTDEVHPMLNKTVF